MNPRDPKSTLRAAATGFVLAVMTLGVAAQARIAEDKYPAEKLLSPAKNRAFIDVDVYTTDTKTGKGKVLRGMTVLVEDGKFTKIGKHLDVPATFERVTGGTLVPGIVYAGSADGVKSSSRRPTRTVVVQRGRGRRIQMPSSRRGSSRATFNPTAKVSSMLKPDDQAFARMLGAGVTTLGVRPPQSGISGQGAAIRPAGHEAKDMVLQDDVLLYIGYARGTATKKMLSEKFAAAKKMIADRKAAKEAAAKKPAEKKPEAKPKAKPAEKKPAEKKPEPGKEPKKQPKPEPKKEPKKEPEKQPKQEPKKGTKPAATAKKPAPKKPAAKKEDPKVAVLTKVIEGKLPVLLNVSGASDVLHAFAALKDTDFPLYIAHFFNRGAQDTLDRVLPLLTKRKVTVICPVELGYKPNTRYYTNPIAKLEKAKVPVMLVPGSSQTDLDELWLRMNEMYRAGIPREALVSAITYAPAKFLGVDKRVGSIDAGKDANFVHFSRDPFSPAANVEGIYLEGQSVELEPRRQ